tara:strand:+ start:269 stop:586 length:318 start_codon:yes stop_codon:yes gene_type:complete
MKPIAILFPILLGFIIYQFYKGKKQNRKTLLALNIGFIFVWLFGGALSQIAIYFAIFNWTDAGRNLFDKLETIIGGILIYLPWYWVSWYLWVKKRNTKTILKIDI